MDPAYSLGPHSQRAGAMRINNLLVPEQPSTPSTSDFSPAGHAPSASSHAGHPPSRSAAPPPLPPLPPQSTISERRRSSASASSSNSYHSTFAAPAAIPSPSHPRSPFESTAPPIAPQKRHHDGSLVHQISWGHPSTPGASPAPTPAPGARAGSVAALGEYHPVAPHLTSSTSAIPSTGAPSIASSAPGPHPSKGPFLVFQGIANPPLAEAQLKKPATVFAAPIPTPALKKLRAAAKPPMRSLIACLNCRKSKIKCENQGPGGACETCIKAGKECRYSEAGIPLKQSESHPVGKPEKENGNDKKRIKRYGDIINPDMNQIIEITRDNLSRDFLTIDLWDKIFELYEQHFLSELPFIHVENLRAAIYRKLTLDEELPHSTNLVLLGLLALTARFHRDLGKYVSHFNIGFKPRNNSNAYIHGHSSQKLDTSSASPFYARILVIALGSLPSALVITGVERVQALLMLGVHEWMQGCSPKASTMYIDAAIRLALDMKMNRELDAPDMPPRYRSPVKPNASPSEERDANLAAEIRRRTMFSCFILDRFVNLGEDTSWLLPAENIRLRLPVMDWGGDKGQCNQLFWPRKSSLVITDPINFDNKISYFVRLIDIWGEISKYSAEGGRALDGPNPPWAVSKFRALSDALNQFTACLPASLGLSKINYLRHRDVDGSLYISIHTIIALCKIMLHREYVPFVALRCQRPVGPLDPPLLPPAPGEFWLDSANILFKASRDIVDLVEWSGDSLPFSPITLFGVWTAAFVGLYARHFPHMDINCHMFDPQKEFDAKQEVVITESGATGVAFGSLKKMASCMAAGAIWQETFTYCDTTFHDITRRFNERQNRRAESGEVLTPDASLETPGGKDLWDGGYGGRITGNSVILTMPSPGHKNELPPGTEYNPVGISMPCSPSDRDGPDTPRDQSYSGPSVAADEAEQYDESDAGEGDDIVWSLERLSFLEIGPWIQKQRKESGKSPDTEALLEWAEKIHWGQTFPGQTNYLDKSLEVH
ncbi:hypothetical protein BROUX41_001212 [Berkeleyomyces rouxiae]|uniref:uncharacterized protein n=1 Tax=Berkeleyomyces rouxiae TaxID=2035830 RepID=UPI003B7FF9AB